MRNTACSAVFVVVVLGFAQWAHAITVLDNGTVRLGVNPQGNLVVWDPNDPTNESTRVGLQLDSTGLDGLRHRGPNEGWGVGIASTGESGWVNNVQSGAVPMVESSNVSVTSFTATPITAISQTQVGNILQVIQAFHPSVSANLYQIDVTLTNLTSNAIAAGDLRYRRVMDWDAEPTASQDLVTIGGLPRTGVIFTSDDGFETADPLRFTSLNFQTGTTGSPVDQFANTQAEFGVSNPVPCGFTVNFTRCGRFTAPSGADITADHGALFELAPGELAAGGSLTFSLFYGATGSTADALSALNTVGAQAYSLAQCDPQTDEGIAGNCTADGGPTTFIFGVNLPGASAAAPEASTLVLLGSGLGTVAYVVRRRARTASQRSAPRT